MRTRASVAWTYPIIKCLHTLLMFIVPLLSNSNTAHAVLTNKAEELNLSSFQQFGIVGDFAGLSVINEFWSPQRPSPSPSIHGSQSLWTNINGTFNLAFQSGAASIITSTCIYSNGPNRKPDLYIAGNFTILNGSYYQNIAKYEGNTNTLKRLQSGGIDGYVASLYCDSDNDILYIGGAFNGPVLPPQPNTAMSQEFSSVNALLYQPSIDQFKPVPWGGFDGPVWKITKNAKRQSILFGGEFSSTMQGGPEGNVTSLATVLPPFSSGTLTQVSAVNLAASNITAVNSDSVNGNTPQNIICDASSSANSSAWLLKPNSVGQWSTAFAQSVTIAGLRLQNLGDGNGTKTFSVTASPGNISLSLQYLNMTSGLMQACSTNCTLSNAPSMPYQDYRVTLTSEPANGITVTVNSWYGNRAGLTSLTIFQRDLTVYAANQYNSPMCGQTATSQAMSHSQTNGHWSLISKTPSTNTAMETTVNLGGSGNIANTNVSFYPYISQTDNYDVYVKIPGCMTPQNCANRGSAALSIYSTPSTVHNLTVSQTNNVDVITKIYSGVFNATTNGFSPKVVLAPTLSKSPNSNTYTLVADFVQLVRNSTVLKSNRVMEYLTNPGSASNSSWVPLGKQLTNTGIVYDIDASDGDNIYLAGYFQEPEGSNILRYQESTNSLQGLGVTPNGIIRSVILNNNTLYVGGDFPANVSANIQSNIVALDISRNQWHSVGGGVDNQVTGMTLTQTGNATQLHVMGNFKTLIAADNSSISSYGYGLWNISASQWSLDHPFYAGTSIASLAFSDNSLNPLVFAIGEIDDALDQAVSGLGIVDAGSTTQQLDTVTLPPLTGGILYATKFWTNTSNPAQTSLIVGGKFNTSNGIQNVAVGSGGQWTGLGGSWQGSVNAMEVVNDHLMLGGQYVLTRQAGQFNALSIYDLADRAFIPAPKLAKGGAAATVNKIKAVPETPYVAVAGAFDSPCSGLCVLDISTYQWLATKGPNLTGEVYDVDFVSNTMVVVGNLSVNGQSGFAATYDFRKSGWTVINGLPGPSSAVACNPLDANIYANATPYIARWDHFNVTVLASDLDTGSVVSKMMLVPSAMSNSGSVTGTHAQLLLAGQLNLTGYGTVSVAAFNGNVWTPWLQTSAVNGSFGLVYDIATKANGLSPLQHLPLAITILIALASAMVLTFIIVGLALLTLYRRNKSAQIKADKLQYEAYFTTSVNTQGGFDAHKAESDLPLTALGTPISSPASDRPNLRQSRRVSPRPRSPLVQKDIAAATTFDDMLEDLRKDGERIQKARESAILRQSMRSSIASPPPGLTSPRQAHLHLSPRAGRTFPSRDSTESHITPLEYDTLLKLAIQNHGGQGPASEAQPLLFYSRYHFQARERGELGFRPSEKVIVVDNSDEVWWMGLTRRGDEVHRGVFPSQYVSVWPELPSSP